ncbi:MAG: HAMP domain-containing protein [bacterium]
MRHTLRTKFFALLILLVLLAVSTSTWLHVTSVRDAMKKEFEARAVSLARFIALQYVNPLLKNQPQEITKAETIKLWIGEAQHSDAEYVELYNTDGQRLTSYSKPEKRIPDQPDVSPSFIMNLLQGDNQLIARSHSRKQIFDYLVPVELNHTQIGVVRIGLDASGYYNERASAITTNIQFGSVLLLLISFIAYVATPYIIQPIKDLAQTARRFGTGDYQARSSVTSGDELTELSLQFNRMADQIKKLIDNLKEAGHYHKIFPYVIMPQQLFVRIPKHLQKNLGIPYAAILLSRGNDEPQEYHNYIVENGKLTAIETPGGPPKVLSELAELTQTDTDEDTGKLVKRSRLSKKLASIFSDADQNDITDALVFRLENYSKFGYLVLARDDRDFPDTDVRLINGMLGQIVTAISNAQNFQEVLVDERSGLYPRKVLKLALKESGEFAGEDNLWLARLGLDSPVVDPTRGDIHLKVAKFINRHGHEAAPVSDTDHFFVASHDKSWQFLVILSGWDKTDVKTMLQNMLADLKAQGEEYSGTTMSAGVTPIRSDSSADVMFKLSQTALDEAKNRGGNAVCFSE